MQTMTRRAPLTVRARKSEIQRLAFDRLGVTTNQALAERLGIDLANLSRVLNGRHAPSHIVIAALVKGLRAKFEDLFTIEISAT